MQIDQRRQIVTLSMQMYLMLRVNQLKLILWKNSSNFF